MEIKMIKTVAHLADIHIKDSRFEDEYKIVFDRTIEKLKELKPDRIVVAGDIFHTKNNVRNEGKLLGGWFLNELAKIARTIVTNGNHDGNPNNKEQINSLSTVIELINNPNICYYNKTGRYEDENVYWYVWDYFDGKNPNDSEFAIQSMPHDHSPETVIDLYHNPVNGARLFNSGTLKHNVSIDDFQGKLFLLGDIHLRQQFHNTKGALGAYPGSLIQQDFGESIDDHGFLFWAIEPRVAQPINIPNDYLYYNLVLDGSKTPINYESIVNENMSIFREQYKYIRVKVKWTDYRSNINKENERKIRSELREFFSHKNGAKLIDLRFEKNTIDKFEGLRSLLKTVNKEDVINKDSLNDIFVRFLKSNKTEDYTISKVLELDEMISKTLVYEEKLVSWRLLNITIDNYRSHGDVFDLPLEGKDGLWQIKGLNEHGKTNLLSAICYLLFGKTLETLKKEKNGDNRFINNKRDLDYCEVKGTFEINGELYEIIRRTDRTWNRGKTDYKTSTTLNYKKLDANFEEVNLNDEQRLKTDKLIHEELGTFEDFLRTSFITADSLNGLLSADEAVFIDSILRDAGLDLFEKKLDIFKEWKKKNPIRKPKIDVDVASAEIRDCEETIAQEEQRLEEIQGDLTLAESKIITLRKNFEKEQKKFQQIEGELTEQEISTIEFDIANLQEEIVDRKDLIKKTDESIKDISEKLTKEQEQNKVIWQEIYDKTNNDFESIKDKQTQIEKKITGIEKEQYILKQEITNSERVIAANKKEKTSIENNLKTQITLIDEQIEKLENGTVCPVCKKTKDAETIKEIQKEIELLLKKQKALEENPKYRTEIIELENSSNKEQSNIKEFNKQLETTYLVVNELTLEIETLQKSYEQVKEIHNTTFKKIEDLRLVEKRIEDRSKAIDEIEKLKLRNENAEIKIENLKKKLEKVEEIKKKIELNKLVEETVKELKNKLVQKESYIEQLKKEITTIQNGVLPMSIAKINDLRRDIDDFIKEEEKEQIQQLYQDCVHRDGIPKMLLSEMKETINIELSNLLSGVSFNVYFDDNLALRMYDHIKPDAVISVIGGSGKQRTFISIALRLALRAVNNRCVNNLLFMDELMGKLVENSVTEFIQLLEEAKSKIEKIFIVEHAYSDQLQPDYIIEVWKDDKGVSHIKLAA